MNWGFGKKPESNTSLPPPMLKANPGLTTGGRVHLTNANRSWTEEFDVVDILAQVMKQNGYEVTSHNTWLEHPDSGMVIQPQLAELKPVHDGGMQTVTTIQVNHVKLVPAGTFEFQHAMGTDSNESFAKGFDQWAQMDWIALLEALTDRPEKCTSMQMNLPATEGKHGLIRRAVLGPVAHFMERPPEIEKQDPQSAEGDEHDFCPCCLLTKSFRAFQSFLEADGFFGIKMFALRGKDGTPQANCRINGEEWEAGAIALREFATTWPDVGYEYRKQYVVLHSLDKQPVSETAL